MSNDLSNNFLHNILSDYSNNSLSNTTQNQFISLLVDFINNSNANENLTSLPFSQNFFNFNQSNILNEVLNNSLMEKNCYKKIINEEGLKKLKEIIYDDSKFETKECVISLEEFKNGDKVIQLPCNHIFHPQSIKTWLKEESSKCPICRYELEYKEIKNKENFNDNSTIITDISQNSYNQMFSNMNFIYNPTQNLHRPRINNFISQETYVNELMGLENEYLLNRNLQNAIISSIYDSNTYDESSSEEEIDIFEAFYDEDD